ncbi:hypothetical protein Mal15_60250 [Stieleria maiorica]|uniref:Carboxypeptidase regulatory-like domain-containing protein n=1 Tax=Stieleria maiorica TaxID=2795974 RepID=A0A5B9MLS1_9BACT|nr:hypothetical protein [Stieleria maiorica]QEG01944.1 hypothetical protein Mal15_60250 [Stieleria maiorica]
MSGRDMNVRMLKWQLNRLGLLLVLPGLVLLPGCADEAWQADTYPAHGTITVNGEPPEGAVVELVASGRSQPDVRNSRPWALVEADGTFALSTYEIGDGAPAGEYDVLIRWPPDASKPSFADRLSGAYSTAEKSPWTFTVKQEENTLPAIEITGAKVQSEERARPPRQAPPGPAVGN